MTDDELRRLWELVDFWETCMEELEDENCHSEREVVETCVKDLKAELPPRKTKLKFKPVMGWDD